jgi:hypothetical protein
MPCPGRVLAKSLTTSRIAAVPSPWHSLHQQNRIDRQRVNSCSAYHVVAYAMRCTMTMRTADSEAPLARTLR